MTTLNLHRTRADDGLPTAAAGPSQAPSAAVDKPAITTSPMRFAQGASA
jgi:hypothetical protein